MGPYPLRPPIMTVVIEDSMDIMIARDTARRAAGLVGFNPARRAQVSSAAAALGELVLKTGDSHTLHMNGVLDGLKVGLQVSAETPFLSGVSHNNVMVALRSKLGDLVDEIMVEGSDPPIIYMFMWLNDMRPTADDEE